MKWQWLVPVILTVVVVCIISWPQLDHFVDINTMAAQRQQLQMEGERRYNDFARVQAPNVKLSADDVADALGQIVPVNTTKRGDSLMSTLSLGLFGPADDGSNKQGDGVERTGVLQEKINFCESITSTNCDTLDDPRYSECGICHKDGVNSKGKKHRGGMYISADDQIRANEVAKTNGVRAVYKPTIGGCDPYNFTVMKESCVAKGRQLDCDEAGAPSSSNECGQCYGGSGALMYVGAKPKSFTAVLHVSHPGFQNLKGNGITVKNTATGEIFPLAPSKKKDILDPKEMYIQLAEGNNLQITIYGVPAVWCGWLSSVDGKRLVGIDVGVQSITPASGLLIAGDKRSKKVAKALSGVKGWDTYKDKVPSTVLWYIRNTGIVPPAIISVSYSSYGTGGEGNYTYKTNNNTNDPEYTKKIQEIASNLGVIDVRNSSIIAVRPGFRREKDTIDNETITLNMDDGSVKQATTGASSGRVQTNVQLNVMVPATLANPFYDVDVTECPAGPLILTAAGAGLMGANSCYNAKGQFNPTVYCLTQLFEAAGGTSAGTLYPDTPEKARALVVNNSLDATVDSINNMANSALYGIDNNDAPVGFAAQKDLALKMLGLTLNNPCDGPTSKTGPHSAACIDYLWRTSGNSAPLGTNVDPASLPYAYCSSDGAAAPLRRPATIQAANSVGDIQSIRNSFHSIFTRAQDRSDFDAQAAMMNACYGIKINKPAGPPPVCPPPKGWIATAIADTWKQLDGYVNQAAIGNDDYIIGVNSIKQIWGRQVTGAWSNIPGALSQVDTKGVYNVGCTNTGAMYIARRGSNWDQSPGAAAWMSIGADGETWHISVNRGVMYRWNAGGWQEIPGAALQVSVGDKDNVWIVGGNSILHNWTGSTWVQSKTPALIKYVSVSAGGRRLAALGVDGNIYASADKGGSWSQIPGNFDGNVSINDNYIIAVNRSNETIYIRKLT
jgi:hypothetical protein